MNQNDFSLLLKKHLNPREIKSIFFLTGAGISAESGLKTFRDQNGLWENHRIEEVATPESFRNNPQKVHDFYNERRKQLIDAFVSPNAAHISLGELKKNFHGKIHVITQNVDNLHERGGVEDVIHMHGELLKIKCNYCGQSYATQEFNISTNSACQECDSVGGMRPDIVWFGEIPYYMNEIEALLASCDLFVSVGTSGQVYPAAMFVQMAKNFTQCKTIELNLEASFGVNHFDFSYQGKASELVPQLTKFLLT